MSLPKPKEFGDSQGGPPRGSWPLALLAVAAMLGAIYWQSRLKGSDADPERGAVSCWTAVDCAAAMAAAWQTRLPLAKGAATLETVEASGGTLIFTQRLKYDRAFHEAAEYPDGKTWAQLQAEFAAAACDQYDHRPLIALGGRVVHRTIFSDGELLDELVIDRCD